MMPKEVIMWILILGVIGVGLAFCTVLIERIVHQRKQAKYDDLHRKMGLPSHDSDPLSRD